MTHWQPTDDHWQAHPSAKAIAVDDHTGSTAYAFLHMPLWVEGRGWRVFAPGDWDIEEVCDVPPSDDPEWYRSAIWLRPGAKDTPVTVIDYGNLVGYWGVPTEQVQGWIDNGDMIVAYQKENKVWVVRLPPNDFVMFWAGTGILTAATDETGKYTIVFEEKEA